MQSTGTIKLMDGFYIGDQHSARDEDFILLNHINAIVNCTAAFIPNYYEHYQIKYSQVEWKFFKKDYGAGKDISQFIEKGRVQGSSVMIHGYECLDEAAGVAAIYIMHKFRWSLFKTLEYLHCRMRGVIFQGETFQLLKKHQQELLNQDIELSYNWDIRPSDPQELVLQIQIKKPLSNIIRKIKNNRKRVSWKIDKVPQMQVIQEMDSGIIQIQNRLRDRILQNVRRIIKQDSLKGKEDISTHQASGKSLNRPQQQTDRSLTLRKHKSSSLLVSMASLQRSQTLKAKIICTEMKGQIANRTVRIQRMKPEMAETQTQQIEIANTEIIAAEVGNQNIQMQHSSSLKQKLNNKQRSMSSKVLNTQLVENTQGIANSRWKQSK